MIRIVCASDCEPCDCCGEPFCELHGEHYADCDCIGPHNAEDLGYRVIERRGKLYAVKDKNAPIDD